jgi:hypothetical protein
MLSDPLFILAALACLAVVAILGFGIGGFGKSGEAGGKQSNRLMQYRIGAQLVAVLFIVLLVYMRRQGG